MHRSILEQNRRAEAHFAATARDFRPFPPALLEQSLPDAWQWAVRRYGPRVAVRGRATTWTYAELDRHARRVAQAVRARLGADPEPVALLCYHDAPGIAAVWGTLLAGKFYAPLDVSSPPARLQTVLRRRPAASAHAPQQPEVLVFEGLSIDPARREVLRHGEPVALTGTEFELLHLLARDAGRVLSRDDILAHLRGHEAELLTRAVDIVVSRLRRKLEPLDAIKTLRNVGYSLALRRLR